MRHDARRTRTRLGGLIAAGAPLLVAAAVACGPSEPEPMVGVSRLSGAPPIPGAASATTAASTPKERWASYEASKRWTKANARRFNSQGHLFGRYDADIVVNDVGLESYRSIGVGRTMPTGAIVANVLVTSDGAPGPIFAMEKKEDGWTYVEVSEGGDVLRRGKLHPCVDCHAPLSSQDELFGVPTTGR
jgi:hypothetical protein